MIFEKMHSLKVKCKFETVVGFESYLKWIPVMLLSK